jgi:hypothetical protein
MWFLVSPPYYYPEILSLLARIWGGTCARPSENNIYLITDHKSQINRACFLGISYL